MLTALTIRDLRGYGSLEASFGPGPQLVWGPNAAGKTSLLEAIVVLAWGHSHRTGQDVELIRWGAELTRVEGRLGGRDGDGLVEVAVTRTGAGSRKRIRVNGIPRRAAALRDTLRVVIFAPEEMLLVVGGPSLRRAALDRLATQVVPAYASELATYQRALQQRNALLRAIREESAGRDQLHYWDDAIVGSGGTIVAARLRMLGELAQPLARAHAEIAPEEAEGGGLRLRYVTNAPAQGNERPADALARRLRETADKEIWNGATLVGPHRDDLAFELDGRELAGFASRGQQRTAILAFKLAELDVLAELDGHPPLLLLDDVFSELDPARRAHLVRRIAALPQAFVTTTTPEDLDPALRAAAASWEVIPADEGRPARLVSAGTTGPRDDHAPGDPVAAGPGGP
jgi:DNA replication and repair protein RecF